MLGDPVYPPLNNICCELPAATRPLANLSTRQTQQPGFVNLAGVQDTAKSAERDVSAGWSLPGDDESLERVYRHCWRRDC